MSAAPAVPEPVAVIVDEAPPPPLTVELKGRRFPIREQGVSLMTLMRLANAAKLAEGGDDNAAGEMITVLYRVLQRIITAEAWGEFEEWAEDCDADADELQGLIEQMAEARAARPTQPRSPSPGGPSTTGPSSAAGSSSPVSSIRTGDLRVQRDLEARGRPDVALVVKRAREASTTSSTG